MPALALAQVLIPMIPTITTGVEHIIAFIESVRTAAKQTGVWTDTMESDFRGSLMVIGKDPAYLQ
jgi:hypothetical protein